MTNRVTSVTSGSDAQQRTEATPQTVRRRQVNVVAEMLARGRIVPEQKQAADEIARVHEAMTAGLQARIGSYGERLGGSAREWPPSLTRAYRERYCPWHDEMSRVPIGHRRSVHDLVLMVVVENVGVRQAAQALGMDQRTVLCRLREALYRYGELAGWLDHRRPLLRPAEIAQIAA